MNKIFITLLIMPFCLCHNAFAFGDSLDDTYREIVLKENNGRLPSYVRRASVNKKNESENNKKEKSKQNNEDEYVLDMFNHRLVEKMANIHREARWLSIIKNVKTNKVSPFDLEEIRRRVKRKDKEAIEIYAWMNANGVGCTKNLNTSWELYNMGAKLGINNATENARAVYKSMTTYQKQTISD